MFRLMKLFVPLYQNVEKNRDVIDIRHAPKNIYSDHNPRGKLSEFGVYLILNDTMIERLKA